MNKLAMILALMLAACGGGGGGGGSSAPAAAAPQAATPHTESLPGVTKQSTSMPGEESAMIEFKGEALYVTFARSFAGNHADSIRIRNLAGAVIHESPWTGGMGTAIVRDGVIHVFGTDQWGSNGNRLIHSTLDENFVPSKPETIATAAPSWKFYNTDITATPDGYVMVYETTVGTHFMHSRDLSVWEPMGGQLGAGSYNGCPTIDYVDGWYLMTYLFPNGNQYVTRVARSSDLMSFEYSGKILLAPVAAEGINNSDLDFIEQGGQVLMIYLDGDQQTWGALRTARYAGGLSQMMREFFK